MQEVLCETHEFSGDRFYKAIKAQEKLRTEYLEYRLAQITAPFSEATKRQIWEWQREGLGTQRIADNLGVTQYKVKALINRVSWPAPTNLS